MSEQADERPAAPVIDRRIARREHPNRRASDRPRDSAAAIASLYDLPFVDLYLRLDAVAEAHYRPVRQSFVDADIVPVPATLWTRLEILREQLSELGHDKISHAFDHVRMRVSRQKMSNGESWAALRRIADRVPTLDELRMPDPLIPLMEGIGKRSGLVIICGATGEGKTTTAFSLLKNWLDRFGSIAYTIEDPVEFMIQGEHGPDGYCYQVEVYEEEEWGEALKTALRWHPRFILVGEIRSPEAANQLLRAATSGHLVITTMHAGSIEESLTALMQMAEMQLGGRAANLLADALIGVFHQKLPDPRKGPQMRFVMTEPDNMGDPVRASVRANKIALLGSYIERQAALLDRRQNPTSAGKG